MEFNEPWSEVGTATRLLNGQPRNSGSILAWCKRFSLFQNIHTGSGAHSAVPEVLFPGVKRTGREVNHVSPPTAVVNNAWSCTRISLPSSAFMAWRGTNLNSLSRCEQKQLSYLNKNWSNSTNFYNIIQCEISHGSSFGGFRVVTWTETDGLRYFNSSSTGMLKLQSVAGKICNTTNAGGDVGCRTPRRSVP